MKRLRLFLFSLLSALWISASFNSLQAQPAPNPPLPQSATVDASGATIVYVSDFDLDVVYRKPSQKPASRTSKPSGPSRTAARASAPQDDSSEETPADRANALVNAVSENLIAALNKAGYDAHRLPANEPLPKVGLRILGVFAEADERNRARRLLVGGQPVSASIILFVGVNNLARPGQPLYELVNPPINDPRHGPVITVTSYAPAAHYELSRDPSDEELKKVAAGIAADFTALLNANPLSLAKSGIAFISGRNTKASTRNAGGSAPTFLAHKAPTTPVRLVRCGFRSYPQANPRAAFRSILHLTHGPAVQGRSRFSDDLRAAFPRRRPLLHLRAIGFAPEFQDF